MKSVKKNLGIMQSLTIAALACGACITPNRRIASPQPLQPLVLRSNVVYADAARNRVTLLSPRGATKLVTTYGNPTTIAAHPTDRDAFVVASQRVGETKAVIEVLSEADGRALARYDAPLGALEFHSLGAGAFLGITIGDVNVTSWQRYDDYSYDARYRSAYGRYEPNGIAVDSAPRNTVAWLDLSKPSSASNPRIVRLDTVLGQATRLLAAPTEVRFGGMGLPVIVTSTNSVTLLDATGTMSGEFTLPLSLEPDALDAKKVVFDGTNGKIFFHTGGPVLYVLNVDTSSGRLRGTVHQIPMRAPVSDLHLAGNRLSVLLRATEPLAFVRADTETVQDVVLGRFFSPPIEAFFFHGRSPRDVMSKDRAVILTTRSTGTIDSIALVDLAAAAAQDFGSIETMDMGEPTRLLLLDVARGRVIGSTEQGNLLTVDLARNLVRNYRITYSDNSLRVYGDSVFLRNNTTSTLMRVTFNSESVQQLTGFESLAAASVGILDNDVVFLDHGHVNGWASFVSGGSAITLQEFLAEGLLDEVAK